MPTNPLMNNKKIFELEDFVSSYAVKINQIALELHEAKKDSDKRFAAIDSQFASIETKMDTRFGSIEGLLRQLTNAKSI